jgi:hypothetical protein
MWRGVGQRPLDFDRWMAQERGDEVAWCSLQRIEKARVRIGEIKSYRKQYCQLALAFPKIGDFQMKYNSQSGFPVILEANEWRKRGMYSDVRTRFKEQLWKRFVDHRFESQIDSM